MIRILASNITSPIGLTTDEAYAAVRRGESALQIVDGCLGVPGKACVGIFSDSSRAELRLEGVSWFESLAIHSIREALSHTDVDPASPRTLLILGSSTAAMAELAEVPEKDGCFLAPGLAAQRVADRLGFVQEPLLVSNACISGATAQMLAARLLSAGLYDHVVVCGADVLSAFVLAGFESFKALSPVECRPFDIDRLGLNIGECAATVILSRAEDAAADAWYLADGCLDNDAYHVSAPIPSGDGVCRCIRKVLSPGLKESLACVTAHGTATMFNDQMESKAIEQGGLGDIPTTAYKAYFGHTFGASSIVESLITMCSLDEGKVLPLRGFEEIGVSGRITVCTREEATDKRAFVKTQSAFGGCNGALVYSKHPAAVPAPAPAQYAVMKSLHITPDSFLLDGTPVPHESTGAALLTEIFKTCLADGSRFFKMDLFSRLAYVGAGLLAKDMLSDCEPEDVALLLFTLNGSVLADRKHLSTFSDPGAFYPSPAVFINTLPNVVLGEIAVRHAVKGETTLVMLPRRDDGRMEEIVRVTVAATRPAALLYGWVDCEGEDAFIADLNLLKIKE